MRLCFLAALLLAAPVAAQPFADPITACANKEARAFDFWLGNWAVANEQRPPGSATDASFFPTGTFHSRVYPVLDGCAIVEESEGTLSWGVIHGFSVRVYDAEQGEWTALMNWANPVKTNPSFTPLAGTADAEQALLYSRGRSPQGEPVLNRVIFSDFTPTSFHWTNGASTDEGATWTSSWTMDAERIEAVPEALAFAGDSVAPPTEPFCDRPAHRATDFLLGHWTGTIQQGSQSRPVVVEAYPFLGGCAIMESVQIGEGSEAEKQFRVRAFDETTERWVLYAISKDTPALVRYEGMMQNDTVTFDPVGPGLSERLTRSGNTLRWVQGTITASSRWMEVARAELQPVE